MQTRGTAPSMHRMAAMSDQEPSMVWRPDHTSMCLRRPVVSTRRAVKASFVVRKERLTGPLFTQGSITVDRERQ